MKLPATALAIASCLLLGACSGDRAPRRPVGIVVHYECLSRDTLLVHDMIAWDRSDGTYKAETIINNTAVEITIEVPNE